MALTSALAWVATSARAVPPLVSGDVPTADKHHVEWYLGVRYQRADGVERQLPFTELVYGLTDRQEITFELPYLSADGQHGLGDAIVGTKFLFVRETSRLPGIAASFELKLNNADESRGLGSGALEYDGRLRAQKALGWFTVIGNLGYTVTEKRNVVFLALAQEVRVHSAFALLSEVYLRNQANEGEPNTLAADGGFKVHVIPHLDLHATAGRSLRKASVGGPALRLYAGLKLEF